LNPNPSERAWPWSRGGNPSRKPASNAPVHGGGANEVDQALDLIAHMLRLIGRVPIGPDDARVAAVRVLCEAWAQHVLTLTPPPDAPASAPLHRTWGSLRQFVEVQRHAEQEHAARGLAELQQAVLNNAGAVRGTLAQERSDSRRLEVVVERLRSAALGTSLELLQDEVRASAGELQEMARERDERQQQLTERISELSTEIQVLSSQVHELTDLSIRDTLTGLLNRAGFDAAIRRTLLQVVPTGQPVSLALVDLDDLKWINDQYGHGVGDRALRALAESLQTICRASDELARIGGDEFAIILPNATTMQAEHVAERFLHELWSRNLPVEEGVVHVSASIGVAEARQTDGPRSWMDRADQWLYRAKGMGKNRVIGEATAGGSSSPP
jgi:diguanylate cyclase (GGDEF)-like protein